MINEPSVGRAETIAASNGLPEEQSRLDQAIRRADDLLVSSLKTDERRRNWRRILWLSLGGLIMLTALLVLLFAFAGDNKQPAADPGKAAQLAQEGWNLFNGQQYGPAIDKFQEAVKLDPKNAIAWNGLGWSQFNSGQFGNAKTSFEKLFELDPKLPAGLNGLGWAQFNTGELDKAEATFKSLLKVDPTISGGLNGLGQLYLRQRKYPEAEKYLLKAAPDAPAAWYGLTRLYLLQGKYADAAKWAKKVVNSQPGDDGAKEMLKAAQDKNLPDELRKRIEPPPAAEEPAHPSGETDQENTANTNGKPDSVDEHFNQVWAERLAGLKDQNWRSAFALGQELAQLPPDEGFNILERNWSKIDNVDTRQQLLKAWDFALSNSTKAAESSRLVDVLNLGMRDPSPDVQKWAISYLTGIAFQDFGQDFPAYKAWYAANRGKPLANVISNSVAQMVDKATKASSEESQSWGALLSGPDFGITFSNVPQARQAAVEAGLPKLLEKWIIDGVRPQATKSEIKLAEQALGTLAYLKLDQEETRRIIAPLLSDKVPTQVRSAAIQALQGKESRWAMDALLEVLKSCVSEPRNGRQAVNLIWPIATALASMDDPKVIPTMIAVIDADNTYDTVYGVGYFGLGRLTGVQYDQTHDGKWWRQWWEKNKERYPDDVQRMEIPHLSKLPETKSSS